MFAVEHKYKRSTRRPSGSCVRQGTDDIASISDPATMSTRLVEVMRPGLWSGILATLTSAGLLLAFQQVVDGAVKQGERRREATATRAEALWRCTALPGDRGRRVCLAALSAEAGNPAALTQASE